MKSWIVIIVAVIVGFAGGLGGAFVYSNIFHTQAKSNTQQSTPITSPKAISPYITSSMVSSVFGGSWYAHPPIPYNFTSEYNYLDLINASFLNVTYLNETIHETILNFTTSSYANDTIEEASFLYNMVLGIASGLNSSIHQSSLKYGLVNDNPFIFLNVNNSEGLMFPLENHLISVNFINMNVTFNQVDTLFSEFLNYNKGGI